MRPDGSLPATCVDVDAELACHAAHRGRGGRGGTSGAAVGSAAARAPRLMSTTLSRCCVLRQLRQSRTARVGRGGHRPQPRAACRGLRRRPFRVGSPSVLLLPVGLRAPLRPSAGSRPPCAVGLRVRPSSPFLPPLLLPSCPPAFASSFCLSSSVAFLTFDHRPSRPSWSPPLRWLALTSRVETAPHRRLSFRTRDRLNPGRGRRRPRPGREVRRRRKCSRPVRAASNPA